MLNKKYPLLPFQEASQPGADGMPRKHSSVFDTLLPNGADKLSEQVFRDPAKRVSLVSKVKLRDLTG